MWYKLNFNTRISVIISVRDSDAEVTFDSIGQGSFGAALASSLNIGCAIFDKTKAELIIHLEVIDTAQSTLENGQKVGWSLGCFEFFGHLEN